jgi:serine/threonine-protein kinase
MKKEIDLCMSCMTRNPSTDSSDKECSLCGWVDNGVHLASYLYPKTMLANRYIIGKLISYNGEAALYVGYDTLTEIKITIKEYMPDALCTRSRDVLPISVNSGELPLYKTYLSEFIELNRSLQSLGSLPGIQKVTDVFSENGTAYAILEPASGSSVKNYLQNIPDCRLGWEQVRELFSTVFTALGRVNAAGIIHRGISPKSVFVNPEGQLYLADFSITAARINGSKINEEVFSGYAAPEQYNSNERHGDWTDVYGLAALLYNALTGFAPQDAQARLIKDELAAPKLINDDIPDKISKAIMSGLELSAEKRTKTVSELSQMIWGASRPSGSSATASTLTIPAIVQPFKSIENTGDTSMPVSLDADIDFEDEDGDEAETDTLAALRQLEREKQKKIKRIVIMAAIAVVLVVFSILIMVAVFAPDVFKRSPRVTTSDAVSTTEPPATTTGDGNDLPTVAGARQVTNFVGALIDSNKMAEWEKRFDFLKFKFEGEYSDTLARDIVFEQSVPHLDIVEHGTKITIKYSLGPEFAKMPSVSLGADPNEVRNQLIGLGVRPENIQIVERESENGAAAGKIDGVNIEADRNVRLTSLPGDETKKADKIIIFVSDASTVSTTRKPNNTTRPQQTTTRTTTTKPVITTTPPPPPQPGGTTTLPLCLTCFKLLAACTCEGPSQ